MAQFSILIIDDHALFRAGVVSMLSTAFADAGVVEYGGLNDALADVAIVPTIILLDIQLHGVSGLEGMASLRRKWPTARIVVVSALDTADMVEEALGRGAAAFLSKTDRPARMIEVVGALIQSAPPEQAGASPLDAAPRATLTPRQNEVLDLLCQGLSNKMIGRRLGVSEHTVRGHVQAMLAILDVSNRGEAAFAARRLGLIR